MSSTTIYTCTECEKSFTSLMGLTGHKRMHGASGGTVAYPNNVCCIYTKKIVAALKLYEYQESLIGSSCPMHECPGCGKVIGDAKKYCSQSCSTKHTNKLRGPRTPETRQKISSAIAKFNAINAKPTNDIVGVFSKLYHCTCAHCGVLTISRMVKKYCTTCSPIYGAEPRNRFKFTFNVYNYPDLFDLDLLSRVGFYAPKGKSGKWNPNGLSRDHRVSVNEALRNNYDPFYITHPVNCELMPHKQNNSKKSKSSITYEELKSMVDMYENTVLRAEASNLA